MENTEQETLEKKALSQFMSGKSLFGKDGAFAPMLKQFIETALEAEMSEYLSKTPKKKSNKRNGKGKKTIKTAEGSFEITTPQDRQSSFEPEIVKKRQTILADNLADKIIGLYGLGLSLRDISSHIKEIYDSEISHTVLGEIIDRIIPQVKEWQNRPLEALYPIVWLDAMYYKVRIDGKVVSRAVYNVLAINKEGHKELIGMYVSENEGANFWLSVLTNLKNRGVKDILIACTDNLKGFPEAIETVFPKVEIQLCVIHQIRNSLKYIASKDQKAFMKELKPVYKASTKEQAEIELDKLEDIWGEKYPIVLKSWRYNWERLSAYFQYDEQIRRLIYTTNAVEGFHRQVRKVTKTKGAFTSDMALQKLIYLTVQNISKKWNKPLANWAITAQQLAIKFEGRMVLDI